MLLSVERESMRKDWGQAHTLIRHDYASYCQHGFASDVS